MPGLLSPSGPFGGPLKTILPQLLLFFSRRLNVFCPEPFQVPQWEVTTDFNPSAAAERFTSSKIKLKTLSGTGGEAAVPSAYSQFVSGGLPCPEGKPLSLLVRDPTTFRAGEIHPHQERWSQLSAHLPNKDEIMAWIANGVSI